MFFFLMKQCLYNKNICQLNNQIKIKIYTAIVEDNTLELMPWIPICQSTLTYISGTFFNFHVIIDRSSSLIYRRYINKMSHLFMAHMQVFLPSPNDPATDKRYPYA